MSSLRPLSNAQRRNTVRFVCDGVKRFSVGRCRELSYSEAYERIIADSLSTVNDGKITFTPEGLRRTTKLNVSYINCASKFLREYRSSHASEPKVSREQPQAALGGE